MARSSCAHRPRGDGQYPAERAARSGKARREVLSHRELICAFWCRLVLVTGMGALRCTTRPCKGARSLRAG
jgi:hypothetical protein